MKSTLRSDSITIYSADSRVSLLTSLKAVFQDLAAARGLAWQLFLRDIKAMYRKSLLGFAWAFIPPLITAGLWIFLKNNNVMSMGDTAISYPVFVLTGTMLWQIFAESVSSPIRKITLNRQMLIKINIPRESLLLSALYEILFNVMIKIILLAIILSYFSAEISLHILLVPIGIIAIILSGFVIGLILAPVGTLYNDIQNMITVVLPFMMYLTPVVYPKPSEGIMATIMTFNPMASLIPLTRSWMTGSYGNGIVEVIIFIPILLVLLLIALVFYRISMPIIIERMGS